MNKKYELVKTDTKKAPNGSTLFRVKAFVSFGDVVKGEVGGYIQTEENLSQEGNAWVSGDARVFASRDTMPLPEALTLMGKVKLPIVSFSGKRRSKTGVK